MDERLHAFAASRGMVFSARDAATLGLEQPDLRRLLRGGHIVRVRRDAYVLGAAWVAAHPEERLALRVRAVMRSRPGSIAAYQSALALHRLRLYRVSMSTVDLLGPVNRVRVAGALRVHPDWEGHDPQIADGFRCVSIPDAIAQVGLRSGVMAAIVPLDAALHDARCTITDVAHALAERARRPKDHRIAEAILEGADRRSESSGESRARVIFADQGFEVIPQYEIRDDDGEVIGRADLLVDGVVTEIDGAVKYGGAQGRTALIAEKRREDRIRALGYPMVRFMTSELDRPEAMVAAVRRARRTGRSSA